jgi:hypothetical protein
LLLCGLNIDLFHSKKSQWLVLEDGLQRDASMESLIDSLTREGVEVRSMKKGFPGISDNKAESFGNYWEMVSHLPLESLDKVIIISYNFASGFNGKRMSLPDNVTWISKEPTTKEFPLRSVKFSNDSVLIRVGRSSPLQTSFTNQTGTVAAENSVMPIPPDTLSLAIYADPEFEYDGRIVRASLLAIEKTIPIIFRITNLTSTEKVSNNFDWIIWLSQKNSGLNNNTIFLKEEAAPGLPLLIRANAEKWQLTKRLNEQVALNEQLALNLCSILLNRKSIQQRADSLDQTIQPEELLWSQNENNTSLAAINIADNQSAPYLLVAIAILLISERLLASKRNA